jgi:uncharacterized protein (DUF427 family)
MWKYTGHKRPPFAETPEPSQESVWDYPRPPKLLADHRRIVVQRSGLLIADSRESYRILETAGPPTFYIPPHDVHAELLKPFPGTSICEWKGAAQYWTLATSTSPGEAIAWNYPRAQAQYGAIAKYFSFYPGRVDCFVDGERVRPQPGYFYGGWITDEIVGPWKGEPGTEGW